MALNADDPTVPVLCADFALPSGVAATDCYAPKLETGPGRNLYWSKTAFAADPTAASVAAKLAPPTTGSAGPDMIGPIVGEFTYDGSGAAPQRVDGRNVSVPGPLKWGVKITNITPQVREMARQTQNGGAPGHFYIVDNNNNWFGGQNGVCNGKASLLLRFKKGAGETDPNTYDGAIEGIGKYDDRVIVSPVPVVF